MPNPNRSVSPKSSTNDKTDYRFKILYAIGMIMVVAGHCTEGGGINILANWFPYYGFHLGLFLFASGYFYKEKSEQHIGQYILKKTTHLLVPLFLWNCFYAAFVSFLSLFGFTLGTPVTIEKLTTLVLTSGHQFLFNLGSWFVVPLFSIQVFNVLFRKNNKKIESPYKEWLILFLFMVIGIFGVYLSDHGWVTGWQRMIVRFASLLPFYEFGIVYRTKLEQHDHLRSTWYFLIILIAQATIIFVFHRPPSFVYANPNIANYGYFMPFISGAIGIALWLRIAKILEPVIGKSKVINLIADNSFSIMTNHFLGFFIINAFYWVVLEKILHTGHFDVVAFKTNFWYQYCPTGLPQFQIFQLIAGLGIPILIQTAINKTKRRIFKKPALK